MTMEWTNVSDKLPLRHDIVYVKKSNGDCEKAYFYTDSIRWIEFYGQKPCHFWSHKTKEALHNVVQWRKLQKSDTPQIEENT